ncbi:MAG: hypothetical protein DRJ96_07615 [Thermoprotei archaeon]|nr:MAG: hypothetical protein DRJ67_08635 [Thermoprotei archaeon]RLE95987.1 MAG: hypothetical protein DRJ96_07615 [Thermoprotei archaeon]
MRLDIVELWLQLTSPLFHGGDEKTGTEHMFRRIKYVVGDEIIHVPYVSGNEVRGKMRRLAFWDLFKRLGIDDPSTKLRHTLLSGGVLERAPSGEAIVDVEFKRKLRRVPLISLFGCSVKNIVVEGKLQVSHCLPLCSELKEYLPAVEAEWYGRAVKRSFYDYLDWTFHTRRGEEPRGREDEQAVQMLYRFEILIPGTIMYVRFGLLDCSELERSAFSHVLKLFVESGTLGGRSSVGYGSFKVIAQRGELPSPATYLEWLEENSEEVLGILHEIEE